MSDQEVREKIKAAFYDAYRQHGLHVVVMAGEVAAQLGLEEAQARRCFDYLSAKQLIRPMTLGGGYAPTVQLVDAVEQALSVHGRRGWHGNDVGSSELRVASNELGGEAGGTDDEGSQA